jgi:2-phosphoglycolate phosphatase
MLKAVLFDLDGTFADTAPDLTRALNVMLRERGRPPVSVEATRPVTSTGGRGMLKVGFDMTPEHPDYVAMRAEFLDLYGREVCVDSRPFPGMDALLAAIAEAGMQWGIVTNKAERFAKPLMAHLDPDRRCACIVGGDTTPFMKPNPEPMYEAARRLHIEPQEAIYVGDDLRDIQAGRAAGMKTVAVRYGYLNGGAPDTWGADWVVDCPQDIIALL